MIDVEILSNDFIKVSSEVVADSVKYQKVKFSFPEHWNGSLKTAVFSNGNIVKNVILNSDSPLYVSDNIYYIPHEVIKAPGFTISVFGILNDTVLTSDNGVVRVRESGMIEGEAPSKPTPSEYQQLIETAKNAESIAQSVRDDANAGAFNGKDGKNGINGVDGKNGYTPQKGVDYFTPEDIAGLNIPKVDKNFTPTSENAQSGLGLEEAIEIERKRADNTFSNTLKGSKSGELLLIDDISPVNHEMSVKISSDTVTDLTAVKVSRYGKNLWCDDFNKYNHKIYSVCPISLSKGNYYVSITQVGAETLDCTVILAAEGDDHPFKKHYIVKNSNGILIPQKITVDDTWTSPKLAIFCNKSKDEFEKFFANYRVQLEYGDTATDYEPYKEYTDYTPTADGTVNGITSLYPNTTLMTDTEGVIIDCEYNRDINKFSGIDVDVPTKTSELINDSNFATQDYVDEEIANFDFIKIVAELPETGLINRTYFVPKEDPNTNDLYDEYMWVDNKWELITTKQIEVDLTEYVKHTDINQSYGPLSENAQSGKAVAEAVASKANITYVDSSINELNSRFPSIKTVMDEVAVAGAQYYLGEVTELNITLPEDAEIGQEIAVSWYNGEVASTLAIDGVMLDFDYTPSANTRSEISCLWDGTYWSVIGMSQDVPSEVVANE